MLDDHASLFFRSLFCCQSQEGLADIEVFSFGQLLSYLLHVDLDLDGFKDNFQEQVNY